MLCRSLTLPDELVVPGGNTTCSLAVKRAIVKSMMIVDLSMNDVLAIARHLNIKHVYMLLSCCKVFYTQMTSNEYWRFMTEHLIDLRFAFNWTGSSSLYVERDHDMFERRKSTIYPSMLSHESLRLVMDKLDVTHGGSAATFDINMLCDCFQPLLTDQVMHADSIWETFHDSSHEQKIIMCRCERSAYWNDEVRKYNKLVAEGKASDLAWKTVFLETVVYGYLSVKILSYFVRPVCDLSMVKIWPIASSVMHVDVFSSPTQVIYPLWCQQCEGLTVTEECMNCSKDLESCADAFDNPVWSRMLVLVCPTNLMSNTARMYLRDDKNQTALASYYEVGTFTLDVTDGTSSIAINVDEERFKYVLFHAELKFRGRNPLAGALLLISLRVKDMCGCFLSHLWRDIVDHPSEAYQGPFHAINFKARDVQFVGFTDRTYECNDMFQPSQYWGVGRVDFASSVVIDDVGFDTDDLLTDENMESPLPNAGSFSDTVSDSEVEGENEQE